MSRKKLPPPPKAAAPIPAALRPDEPEKETRSWEFRSLKFAMRAMGFCFFIAYLSFLTPSAVTWIETKWVRNMRVEELPEKADYYLNKVYKPEKLYKIVSRRPGSDIEKTIETLMPYTARMSSFTFLFYSSRLDQIGKTDESLFWWQFGRYRARFDALRCGSPKAVDNVGTVLGLVPHPEFPDDEDMDKFTVEKSLKRVLALDAKYPADNLPEDLCDPLRAMEGGKWLTVPPPRWADIRYTLRYMTEYRMRQMNGTLKVDESLDFQKQVDACDKIGSLKKKKDCLKKLCQGMTDNEQKNECLREADELTK